MSVSLTKGGNVSLTKIAPALTSVDVVRKFAFRTVSQMIVNYRRGPLSAQVAVTQCDGGDVNQAIAVLEDQLKRNKFTLPPRG